MNNFFAELKRRNVVRVAIAYAVVSWVVLQFVDIIKEIVIFPDWFSQMVLVLLIIGFPIILIISWAFEVTPEGVKKTAEVDASKSITHGTGQRINKLIAAALVVALGFIAYDKLIAPDEPQVQQANAGQASIAVLPFVNLSSDAEQEYFSDGISEELLNVLAKIPELRVVARTSSFQFKGENRDVTDIGLQLNVAYILEGSVRKGSGQVRITAQLIDASNGFHLWSNSYDRSLEDVFAVQDEISNAIVDELKTAMGLVVTSEIKTAQTTKPEAYEQYLLGRHLMNQRTRSTLEEAAEHFRTAIRLDESYAPAYANLAITYGLLSTGGGYGTRSVLEARELMAPLAERANDLAPDLAETQGAFYWVKIFNAEYEESYKALDRAQELNPSYMDVRIWKAAALGVRQLYRERLEFSSDSVRLDPLNIVINNNHVEYLAEVGRYAEAKEVADRVNTVSPAWGKHLYGWLEYDKGNIPGALEHYLSGLRENPGQTTLVGSVRILLMDVGLTEEATRFPDPAWYIYLEHALQNHDWDQARGIILGMLERIPDSAFFQSILGVIDHVRGDYSGALEAYEVAWAQNPNPAEPVFYQTIGRYIFYADLLREVGEDEKAKSQFAMALRGLGNMKEAGYVSEHYYQLKGMALLYQGEIEAAIDAFEQSFEAGNRDPDEFRVPLFNTILDHPRYQALLEKYRATREADRKAVLEILCAGDLPNLGWQPLEATCNE